MTLAKINGVAVAGIAKVNGIAKASISKYYGQSFPSAGYTAQDSSSGGTTSSLPVGNLSITQKISSSFVAGSSYTLTKLDMNFKKVGTPSTRNMTVDIFASSGGLPTGSTLGTSSTTYAANSFESDADGSIGTVTFAGVALTSGTTYCMVFTLSGSTDASNYCRTINNTSAGTLGLYNGSSWSVDSTGRINFTSYSGSP